MVSYPISCLLCLILIVGTACDPSSEPEDSSPDLSGAGQNANAQDARRLIDESAVVIDVRTAAEFSSGHIDGAHNVDVRAGGFEASLESLDRAAPYVVHCAVGAEGGRSVQAVARMHAMGFTNLYHLDGGFNAWSAASE